MPMRAGACRGGTGESLRWVPALRLRALLPLRPAGLRLLPGEVARQERIDFRAPGRTMTSGGDGMAEVNPMRIVLAIERDLNDRRGFHLSSLDAEIRRTIRKRWLALVRKELGL